MCRYVGFRSRLLLCLNGDLLYLVKQNVSFPQHYGGELLCIRVLCKRVVRVVLCFKRFQLGRSGIVRFVGRKIICHFLFCFIRKLVKHVMLDLADDILRFRHGRGLVNFIVRFILKRLPSALRNRQLLDHLEGNDGLVMLLADHPLRLLLVFFIYCVLRQLHANIGLGQFLVGNVQCECFAVIRMLILIVRYGGEFKHDILRLRKLSRLSVRLILGIFRFLLRLF